METRRRNDETSNNDAENVSKTMFLFIKKSSTNRSKKIPKRRTHVAKIRSPELRYSVVAKMEEGRLGGVVFKML